MTLPRKFRGAPTPTKRIGYDRCPSCLSPMTFEGVANRKGWTRWTSCAACGTWVVANEHGVALEASKHAAAKGQFRTGREIMEPHGA